METTLHEINLVKGKLQDIMLPASPSKTVQMREKLIDINTDISKVCLQYLDSCQEPRMIDLMTICHILNREQLYILEDEETVEDEDFIRSLETIVSIND